MLFQLLTSRRAASEDTLATRRTTMTTGFPMLDVGLVATVFIWLFYWMYSLSSRSHAERIEQRRNKSQAKQPWDPNVSEGRRNRQ
jgi:hypothetical protein